MGNARVCEIVWQCLGEYRERKQKLNIKNIIKESAKVRKSEAEDKNKT